MGRLILERLASAVPTLLVVLTVAFLTIRLAPGDPAQLLLGDGPGATPEALADLRRQLGTDRPVLEQYGRYVLRVLGGDLGTSFRSGRPVLSEIRTQLPYTLLLAAAGVAFAVAVGVPAGIVAALRRDSWVDTLTTTLAMLWVSSPSFWFAILLIYLFGFRLGWLPLFGAGTWGDWPSLAQHLVLPMVAVGARSAALIARMSRSALLDVLASDYVRTARAKGAAAHRVVLVHALRNAAIPILTVVGLDVASLVSGTVVIETVFSRPGLGKLVVDAVNARDYAAVQGGIVAFGVFVLVVNLAVDLAYAWIDPRVRYA
jgi:peptide/nickel transport system permease protein